MERFSTRWLQTGHRGRVGMAKVVVGKVLVWVGWTLQRWEKRCFFFKDFVEVEGGGYFSSKADFSVDMHEKIPGMMN